MFMVRTALVCERGTDARETEVCRSAKRDLERAGAPIVDNVTWTAARECKQMAGALNEWKVRLTALSGTLHSSSALFFTAVRFQLPLLPWLGDSGRGERKEDEGES